jgi:catechol 2,3-dioxygenase-like lactoylglutathione lyase family enzyme
MQVNLFAGIPVRDYEEALAWYKRLLGSEPSFLPHATEAVWEFADHPVPVHRGAAGARGPCDAHDLRR